MSIYRCASCDEMKDNDYDTCEEHPWRDGELVCEDCHATLVYEMKMCAEEDYHEDD